MGSKLKVLDPACGTGGFLVYLMQEALGKLQVKLKNRDITKESYDQCVKRIKEDIFMVQMLIEGLLHLQK